MPATTAARAVPSGAAIMEPQVLIRYIGAKSGAQTWRTPSGYNYRFNKNAPLLVRREDASFFTDRQDFQQVGQ